jgi:hypothetical protein
MKGPEYETHNEPCFTKRTHERSSTKHNIPFEYDILMKQSSRIKQWRYVLTLVLGTEYELFTNKFRNDLLFRNRLFSDN